MGKKISTICTLNVYWYKTMGIELVGNSTLLEVADPILYRRQITESQLVPFPNPFVQGPAEKHL